MSPARIGLHDTEPSGESGFGNAAKRERGTNARHRAEATASAGASARSREIGARRDEHGSRPGSDARVPRSRRRRPNASPSEALRGSHRPVRLDPMHGNASPRHVEARSSNRRAPPGARRGAETVRASCGGMQADHLFGSPRSRAEAGATSDRARSAEVQPREVGEAAVAIRSASGSGAKRARAVRESRPQAHERQRASAAHRNRRKRRARAQLDVV